METIYLTSEADLFFFSHYYCIVTLLSDPRDLDDILHLAWRSDSLRETFLVLEANDLVKRNIAS